jgi:hypothetical protein
VNAGRYGLTSSAAVNGIACARPPLPSSVCPDLSGNGQVGSDDLLRLAFNYKTVPSSPGWDPVSDIDANLSVSGGDLLILAFNYQTTCAIPNPSYLP